MNSPAPPLPTVDEARALRAAGEWQALVQRVAPFAREELLREPELAYLYAVACRRVGQTAEALALGGELEPEARRRGDRRLLGDAINLVGVALWESGRAGDAEERFGELLDLASTSGNEESTANACNNLGVLANVRGRRDLALTFYQRALAAYRRVGNAEGLARTHQNLGISYRDLGFDGEADRHFTRVIELGDELGADELVAMAEIERASLRVRRGDAPLGAEMARRAEVRFQRIGSAAGAADARRVIAAAEREQGRLEHSLEILDESLAVAVSHDDLVLRAEVQRDRGLLLRDRGDIAAARDALADAVSSFARIGAEAEAEALRAIIAELAP